ncbi:MAG: hypothetical protein CMA63_05610 [Euryarchaeota archaeon]|nr:hypothetical protein [Euryarchaeota archaeon]|tara:strand:- start:3838 stop:4491 length:654 start_codon:yes stop_codon:yes gene_type:complete
MRPKHLAIELSKLQPHPCVSVELEQYATEGDLASYWIRAIEQLDGLDGKRILDLGAGNGILGIGCVLLGAVHATLIEADAAAVEVIQTNIQSISKHFAGEFEVRHEMVSTTTQNLEQPPDIVVMNPPWGVQTARADRPMLEYAFSQGAGVVHVLHSAKAHHVQAIADQYGYQSEAVFETEFRLPPTYQHHTKRKATTSVRCWRFHRPGDTKLNDDEQ